MRMDVLQTALLLPSKDLHRTQLHWDLICRMADLKLFVSTSALGSSEAPVQLSRVLREEASLDEHWSMQICGVWVRITWKSCVKGSWSLTLLQREWAQSYRGAFRSYSQEEVLEGAGCICWIPCQGCGRELPSLFSTWAEPLSSLQSRLPFADLCKLGFKARWRNVFSSIDHISGLCGVGAFCC